MSDALVIIGSSGANLASLGFAFKRLGVEPVVTEDPARIAAARRVVLPGVGAAADAMQRLEAAGLTRLIGLLSQPLLGICLGMQLLFTRSEEDDAECLGIIPGTVRKLSVSADLPVPHMGWNEIELRRECPLLTGIGSGAYAYFVHSYAAPVEAYTCATTDYDGEFASVVQWNNFFGTQFHPERSSTTGSRVLENFLEV